MYIAASRRSFQSVAFEKLLVAVDSELDSLASEEEELRDMRISLSSMRRVPIKTVHINALPPEILVRVFALSRSCCVHSGSDQVEFHDLAAVCSYWRQVAMNTTDLWTHIDIGPGIPTGLINLLLKRTRDSLIHVHVHEPTPKKADQAIGILTPHIRRVRTLDIKSYSESQGYVGAVLNLWLNNGSPSVAGSLVICRPNYLELLSASVEESDDGTIISQSENAYRMTRSLSTLHLYGVKFDWNSSAYHGLVDLRLHFLEGDYVSISISQLAEILSASPSLAVLKLAYLEIKRPKGCTQPTPVVMSHLNTLNLVRMDSRSLNLLLPLIDLSTTLAGISLGILVSRDMQNEFGSFLIQSRITTLYYEDNDSSDSSLWRSFLHSASHHHTLILSGVRVADALPSEASPNFYQASSASCLPSVVLLGCGVNFEGLKNLIGNHGIKQLRLEKCWVPKGRLQDLHGIKPQLVGVYPKLRCSISGTDSTRRFPCRTMFIP